MDAETRGRIQSTIDSHDVVLFMKGTPAQPRCGFSATVVQILDSMGVAYASVDVLSDPAIREGIKEFSDWPTIPQVYVKKEFLGGCDIVKEMFGSGELEEKLGVQVAEVPPPQVTVTERAAKALAAAVTGPDEGVRFGIDARFNYELSIGSRSAKDIVVESNGVKLLLDRASAGRAGGSTIDYVDTPEGAAFKIENPNEPPKVRQLPPRALAEKLKSGERIALYDVRTPTERAMAQIAGSTLVDRDVQQQIMALPRETPLAFYCHHGSRSLQAAEFFLSNGFKNVYNLAGGIDAWSIEVDPRVARY